MVILSATDEVRPGRPPKAWGKAWGEIDAAEPAARPSQFLAGEVPSAGIDVTRGVDAMRRAEWGVGQVEIRTTRVQKQ